MYIPLISYLKPPSFEPLIERDAVFFLFAIFISISCLLAPPTPGRRLFGAAVCAPLTTIMVVYWSYYTVFDGYQSQWGLISMSAFHAILAWQHLVFCPAEEYNYRVRPAKAGTNTPTAGLVAEPIPPPWTWAKFCWATSLWWSWRGIGWNYAAPLPPASTHPAFAPTASRRRWAIRQLAHFIPAMLAYDAVRAYMNCDPGARAYFTDQTPSYADLSQWDRGVYSACVALRLFLGMQKSFVPCGMVFIALGGLLGWDSEFFAPWGWPPLFAGVTDLWRYPGLSVAWGRLWHQYFRRWLYIFGWKGIGEKVLRLPRSGPDPRYPLDAISPTSTPLLSRTTSTSGRTSPTHPLPPAPTRRTGLTLVNLVKSFCVFALTGIIHDYAYYLVLFHLHDQSFWKTWRWTDAIISTKFFISQPFGIAFEAVVKKAWRRWKRARGLVAGNDGWLAFVERLVGFVWTWTFLGWTAGWFVEGMAFFGGHRRDETQGLFWSLAGGVMYGKWYH